MNCCAGRLNPRSVDPVVAAMLEHLTVHATAPLRLQEVVDLAGYTPQHVNRLFKRRFGRSPTEYRTAAAGEGALSPDRLERATVA